MQFIFRTNASKNVGLGHLSRCISLMNFFNKIQCKIFIDRGDNNISNKYNKSIIKSLYNKKNKFNNELNDARIFAKVLSKNKQDYVFVDDYRLGYRWEKKISKYCKKIICIDDFINRKHHADVYINTKLDFLSPNNKISNLISRNNKSNCKFLLGPKFYLPQIKLKNIKKIKNKKKFIFSFYNGGSGNVLIYKKIIKKLIKRKPKGIQINIIVGTFSKNILQIKKIFKNDNYVKIIYNPKNIYNTFYNTDFLISSAGIVTYEATYLNIPSIFIKMARNQENSNLGFEKIGQYFILEKKEIAKTEKFVNLLINIKNNFKRINKLNKNKVIKLKPNYKKLRKIITNA